MTLMFTLLLLAAPDAARTPEDVYKLVDERTNRTAKMVDEHVAETQEELSSVNSRMGWLQVVNLVEVGSLVIFIVLVFRVLRRSNEVLDRVARHGEITDTQQERIVTTASATAEAAKATAQKTKQTLEDIVNKIGTRQSQQGREVGEIKREVDEIKDDVKVLTTKVDLLIDKICPDPGDSFHGKLP